MRILQINATCGAGSTGKICMSVSKILTDKGIENYILYSFGQSDYPLGIKYQSDGYTKLQALLSRIFGNYGFGARLSTKKLIKKIRELNPDIVHLHNLHSHNCNLEMLFKYFKKTDIKLYWTFHDCWAFTAYCPYFDSVGCDRWRDGCYDCPKRREFSWFFDRSPELYRKKKALLAGLDLTVVTPSRWLGELVGQSFLKDCKVKVINNGIDLDVFKPTESDFRQKYGIGDGQKILLGVSFEWEYRKGLDVFVELHRRLDPDKYCIVLVGTNDEVDKQLPSGMISIHRTQNQRELAEIYTAADILVNPTREENYPTVNMEAIACATPVLTFRTGGSPEIIDESCGYAVDCGDVDAMEREIIRICNDEPYTCEACLVRARAFNMNDRYKEYVELYEE